MAFNRRAAFNRVNTVMQYHCRSDELGTGPICVYQRGGGGLIIDFFCGGVWGWGVKQRENLQVGYLLNLFCSIWIVCFNHNYYSFKIFPQFWLAKSTCIIHHNQLLMTKLGRILCLTRKWHQKCSLLQVNAQLSEKTWGRGWIVLVVIEKWRTFHWFQE